MSTLYVDQQGSRLGFESNCLVLTPRDGIKQTFPCRVVSRLVIIGHINLTPALLDHVMFENVPTRGSDHIEEKSAIYTIKTLQ